MEQLLLHLVGDYIFQTDWMAKNKHHRFSAAALHATTYTVPFLLIAPSLLSLLVIGITHAFIDHYRLARYVIFAKNWTTDRSLRWADVSDTGLPKDTPQYLSMQLVIIVDNTLHLLINYAALRWL